MAEKYEKNKIDDHIKKNTVKWFIGLQIREHRLYRSNEIPECVVHLVPEVFFQAIQRLSGQIRIYSVREIEVPACHDAGVSLDLYGHVARGKASFGQRLVIRFDRDDRPQYHFLFVTVALPPSRGIYKAKCRSLALPLSRSLRALSGPSC